MFSNFFFTALETLLNREYESEWLIHKWDPDSVVGTQTPPGAPLKKKRTFCFLPSKTQICRLRASWYCSCKNASRRGQRDSLWTRKLLVHPEQGSPSTPWRWPYWKDGEVQRRGQRAGAWASAWSACGWSGWTGRCDSRMTCVWRGQPGWRSCSWGSPPAHHAPFCTFWIC